MFYLLYILYSIRKFYIKKNVIDNVDKTVLVCIYIYIYIQLLLEGLRIFLTIFQFFEIFL